MAGLQSVSSFTAIVPVSAVIPWPAQSSWSFTEKTALDCPLLPAVHGVAITPSSCLSTSCSNFFACPDIILRLIIMRWMTGHRLSSVPGLTAFPPPDSAGEPWQRHSQSHVCRSWWWQLVRKFSWSPWDCPLRTNPPRFLMAYQQIPKGALIRIAAPDVRAWSRNAGLTSLLCCKPGFTQYLPLLTDRFRQHEWSFFWRRKEGGWW